MISYFIEAYRPSQHIFNISFSFISIQGTSIVQLPYWRPGRYEAGNFARNIIGFNASANGEPVKFEKTTSNTWKVETPIRSQIKISYRCYAAELTAGNTYLDENFLLINPVNALMYVHELENRAVEVNLKLDKSWKVATAMLPGKANDSAPGEWEFKCQDLQELLDTPIMASQNMRTLKYRQGDTRFFIDLCGDGIGDLETLQADFESFTKTQIEAFGKFPVKRYRFLIMLLPHKAYHGVEHETSTVIIIGPSANLNKRELYKELIGVSSHELYHTWNVKNLRPAEFTPYDFTGPTFSKLGYITEGITTYMGDKMLWQSRFFSDEEFLNELSIHVQRHIDNEGRHNLSLANASVDTWVDGYGRGTPRRRVSIYVEGALVAFVCDVEIWKATGGKKSLNHVMRALYEKYGDKKGFVEKDYWDELKAVANINWDDLKQKLIYETGYIYTYVRNALKSLGLSLSANASKIAWERDLGISVAEINGAWEIINVLENSPAEEAGLWFGDKVLKVNGSLAAEYFAEAETTSTLKTLIFEVYSGINLKTIRVVPDGEVWRRKYKIVPHRDRDLFEKWKEPQVQKTPQ